jgi:hypothetical protein
MTHHATSGTAGQGKRGSVQNVLGGSSGSVAAMVGEYIFPMFVALCSKTQPNKLNLINDFGYDNS